MKRVLAILATAILSISAATRAEAGGGPFGIDHRVAYDNSGIWKRTYQIDLTVGTAVVVTAGALWEGDDSKLGDTFWRSLDSTVLSVASAQVMKFAFSRERPSATADPNQWFKGHGNQSFPSGEVAEVAGAVTPFIVAYGDEQPAVYALAVLPVYDAIARVKVRGHWQSDVLVGGALGVAWGVYAGRAEKPFFLDVLPRGIMVGVSKHF